MGKQQHLRGVLFDLDGTLLDTAPDFVAACNAASLEFGLAPQNLDVLRPYVTDGAPAMLDFVASLNGTIIEDFEALHERMLELYEANIALETRYFSGIAEVLDQLEVRGLGWGIVTNKISRFTDPLLEALGIATRAGCVISGDTTAHAKPHPLPMLEASRRIGLPPDACVYIGDHRRDIEAGKNAGMATLAALYGYVPADDPAHQWGADALLKHPKDILAWLDGDLA